MADTKPADLDGRAHPSFIVRFFRERPELKSPLGLAAALVMIGIIITIINPAFASQRNITNIARSVSIYLVIASGMTIVMGSGGIDLSVGSVLALGANVAGTLLEAGFGTAAAIVAAVIVGLAAGLVNGVAIAVYKIPPLITTLATMTIFRGANYLMMRDRILRLFPESFKFIGQGSIGPIPMIFVLGVLVTVGSGIFLHKTRSGKYILAKGGGEVAAKRFGIDTRKYEILPYVILGGLSAFGGVMLASRLNATQALVGIGTELHVIVIVVLGGTYLFGGHATLLGTFVGAVFLAVAENGLVLARVPFFYQQIVIGTILIVTVAIQLSRFRSTVASD